MGQTLVGKVLSRVGGATVNPSEVVICQPDLVYIIELGFLKIMENLKRWECSKTASKRGHHERTLPRIALLSAVSRYSPACTCGGGLYFACGLNSQGVMHSPAVGRLMVEYILGMGCDTAISLLRLSHSKMEFCQKEEFSSNCI